MAIKKKVSVKQRATVLIQMINLQAMAYENIIYHTTEVTRYRKQWETLQGEVQRLIVEEQRGFTTGK